MDRDIGRIAHEQHGVFSRAQALELGGSRESIGGRLSSGRWEEVLPSIYAVVGAPLSWKGRAMAASLWSAPDGALSHRTAGMLLGLEGLRYVPLEVSCLRGIRSPGPLVHRPRRLPGSHLMMFDGIRTTTPVRTLIDLCAVCRPWEAEAAFDSALSDGLVGRAELREMLLSESRQGRNGVSLFRQLIETRFQMEAAPGSVLATDFLRWLIKEGFEGPHPEFRVTLGPGWVFDLDFAYPERKMGFEVDGYRVHRVRAAFDRDRERENLLKAHGWLIIRVTHSLLRKKPDELRYTIRAAMAQRPA